MSTNGKIAVGVTSCEGLYYEVYKVNFTAHLQAIRCGLVVRIPGFHPGGPGSIPGIGTTFFLPKNIVY